MKLPALFHARAKSVPTPQPQPDPATPALPGAWPQWADEHERPAADPQLPPLRPFPDVTRPAPPAGTPSRPQPRFTPKPATQAPAAPAPAAPAPAGALPPTAPPPTPAAAHRPVPPVQQPKWTARAIIGDDLWIPAVWCQFGSCIARFTHPDSLGEHDVRHRALAAGWRWDALNRVACPSCVQHDAGFWPRRAPATP